MRKLSEHVSSSHKTSHPYMCRSCYQAFDQQCKLEDHQASSSHCNTVDKLECNICGKLFAMMGTLNRHKEIHDKNPIKHQCHLCKKQFASKQNLVLHQAVHEEVKPFPCTLCSRAFARKKNLERHMEWHETFIDPKSEVSDVICNVCELVLPSLNDLKEHVTSMHKTSHPFVCNFCQHAYQNAIELDSHRSETKHHPSYRPSDKNVPINTVGDKVQCDLCLKLFSSKNGLIRHRVFHKMIRDYSCSLCNRGFLNSDALQRHMQVHKKHKSHVVTKSRVQPQDGVINERLQEAKTNDTKYMFFEDIKPMLKDTMSLDLIATKDIKPVVQDSKQVTCEETKPMTFEDIKESINFDSRGAGEQLNEEEIKPTYFHYSEPIVIQPFDSLSKLNDLNEPSTSATCAMVCQKPMAAGSQGTEEMVNEDSKLIVLNNSKPIVIQPMESVVVGEIMPNFVEESIPSTKFATDGLLGASDQQPDISASNSTTFKASNTGSQNPKEELIDGCQEGDMFRCSLCAAQFYMKESLDKHLATHTVPENSEI